MESSALDSFWTGVTTLAALTPAGMLLGIDPAGAPEGWGAAETVEAATGWDTSDAIDADDGGALGATARSSPGSVVSRGLDAASEGGVRGGILPEWWRPWMTRAAIGAAVLSVVAYLAAPYVAPIVARRLA